MSPQQLKRYQRERKSEYLDEMDEILPDSLDQLKIVDDEYGFESNRQKKGKQVFGRNIFNNRKLSFEPNMNIATPQDYRLGPGDAVYIDVWGLRKDNTSVRYRPRGL